MIRLMSRNLETIRPVGNETLQDLLNRHTKPGKLYKKEDHLIRCFSCALHCKIKDGKQGVCRVRFVKDGVLYVPWGYVAGVQVDPIEKKPFFHVLPGSDALSWGMLGCDMHCSYCQNWLTSQTLRDAAAGTLPLKATPEDLVSLALESNSPTLVSTYNEPLITSEWNYDVFKLGKEKGLYAGYVSNGNATEEVLDFLRPVLDFYKIDLKTFNDRNYRALGTTLDKVLQGIQMVKEKGFWLEVVTLVVPGFNDSEEELRKMARFLADVSPEIPWHVTAFHPDYKMTDRSYTPTKTLIKAAEIGKQEGLLFVYAGNIPGGVGKYENTYCPHCNTLLVERYGFYIKKNRIEPPGRCPNCKKTIPGRWFRQ